LSELLDGKMLTLTESRPYERLKAEGDIDDGGDIDDDDEGLEGALEEAELEAEAEVDDEEEEDEEEAMVVTVLVEEERGSMQAACTFVTRKKHERNRNESDTIDSPFCDERDRNAWWARAR
jgi:hypothetical protein